jgi:DNA mismatch repair protein MutL
MPTIDFDQRGSIDIPMPPGRGSNLIPPEIEINRNYNPFQTETGGWRPETGARHWEKLYQGIGTEGREDGGTGGLEEWESGRERNWEKERLQYEESDGNQSAFPIEDGQAIPASGFLQLKNRYLLTPVKSGLMVIDQREAHARILYENFMQNFTTHLSVSQRQLFPPVMELNAADAEILNALRDELHQLGFEIRPEPEHHFFIDGTPGALSHLDAKELVESVIASFHERPVDLVDEIKVRLAMVLAYSSAITYGVSLKQEEMADLFNRLFACQSPGYSPGGRKIISIIAIADIEKFFKN